MFLLSKVFAKCPHSENLFNENFWKIYIKFAQKSKKNFKIFQI